MKEQVTDEDCRVERNEHAVAMLGLALMSQTQIKRLNPEPIDQALVKTRVKLGKAASETLLAQARDCKLSDARRQMLRDTVQLDRRYCARLLRAVRQGLSFFDAHDAAYSATRGLNAGGAQ